MNRVREDGFYKFGDVENFLAEKDSHAKLG
jgi:hypothetical protein